jgi:phage terminase large subunit-like protein
MDAASIMIENGFVYLPDTAPCLSELMAFPKSKYYDRVHSISQALNWIQNRRFYDGVVEYYMQEAGKILNGSSL